MNIAYIGITVVNSTFDLCTIAQQDTNVNCPLAEGAIAIIASQDIPSLAPPGHYTGTVNVYDQNGQGVLCVALDFTMGGMIVQTPFRKF